MSKERVMVFKPSDSEALSVSLVETVLYTRAADWLLFSGIFFFSLLATFQKSEGPCGH